MTFGDFLLSYNIYSNLINYYLIFTSLPKNNKIYNEHDSHIITQNLNLIQQYINQSNIYIQHNDQHKQFTLPNTLKNIKTSDKLILPLSNPVTDIHTDDKCTFLVPDYQQVTRISTHVAHSPSQYINNLDLRMLHSQWCANIIDNISKFFTLSTTGTPMNETIGQHRRCFAFLKSYDQIFDYYFRIAKIIQPLSLQNIGQYDYEQLNEIFSFIKRYYHSNCDTLPAIFYSYVELDSINSTPKHEFKANDDNATKWLSGYIKDVHNENWWQVQILNTLSANSITNNEPLLSFSQFIRSPWLWVTPGACHESKLKLNGESVDTKFGAAVSLTPEQLEAAVLKSIRPDSVNITIFEKGDEKGFKRRLIANGDLGSYLITAYIRYLIEYLDGSIPQWMTASPNLFVNTKVMELIQTQTTVIPLDESQFDHHLSWSAWTGLDHALHQLFPNNIGVHMFSLLLNNTLIREGGNITKWSKGMPSGLAITAICNSLFNFIKQQAIASPIHYALGDDVLLASSEYSLKYLSDYYASFGAELNPSKNWLSKQHGEYLHFLYSHDARTGYPARIYGSLIFAVKFTDTTPLQRLNELALLFKEFFDRLTLPMDENIVAADLSRAVSTKWAGFSAVTAKEWLHIPSAVGGFGCYPYVYKRFEEITETIGTQEYTGNRIRLRPKAVTRSIGFKITHLTINTARYRLGPTLKLPKIQTLEDWEKSINMDYPGYSKLELTLGFSVIPLPKLPYISVNRMSEFAHQASFNAYPNLSGNITSVTTRLIMAGLALVGYVQQILSQQNIKIYL